MNNKMYGRIKWFKENKGYGYIIGYDEETYYFKLSSFLGDVDDLNADDEVMFIPNIFTDIPYADEIELCDDKEK